MNWLNCKKKTWTCLRQKNFGRSCHILSWRLSVCINLFFFLRIVCRIIDRTRVFEADFGFNQSILIDLRKITSAMVCIVWVHPILMCSWTHQLTKLKVSYVQYSTYYPFLVPCSLNIKIRVNNNLIENHVTRRTLNNICYNTRVLQKYNLIPLLTVAYDKYTTGSILWTSSEKVLNIEHSNRLVTPVMCHRNYNIRQNMLLTLLGFCFDAKQGGK